MQKKSWLIIIAFAILKFLVPFLFIHPAFQLHRDEYLYLADADHLDWGYIEMPPLLAFLGFISKLLGGSLYTVYLWGGLFGAATMVLIGKTVLQLKGDLYAVFIACLGFLCSGFLRLYALFQPNLLDVFFWTLSAYSIICLIQTNHKRYLYFIGITFGLGILSKYTIFFFIIAFGVSVLLTLLRKWLLNKHFYFAMLLGLLIALPNFLWQYHHHFPVVHHMQLLKERLLDNVSARDFLVDQLLITLPSFFIWMMGLWYLFFNKKGRQYIAVGIIYLTVILLLLYFKGKGYYAAGLYPIMLAIGAYQLSNSIQNYKIKIVQYLVPIVILFLVARIFPVVMPYLSPNDLAIKYTKIPIQKTGALKWEDGENHPLPQDFADMLGWEEMAQKTARVYHQLPDSIQQKTMVYGDNYGEAGALAFYKKKYHLPEIYSDDASFAFWLPSTFKSQYFLFATHYLPDKNDIFFKHFKTVEIKDSVTEKYAREYGAKIILYSFPDNTAISIANKNIQQLKATYNMQ
jgi:4-amino-4-deoxy-L-arabinose transferase-like glycosyltransferase